MYEIYNRAIFSILKIFRNFPPLTLSKDPCDTPMIKIKNKQNNGDNIKLSNLNSIKEKMLQNKKKIKE